MGKLASMTAVRSREPLGKAQSRELLDGSWPMSRVRRVRIDTSRDSVPLREASKALGLTQATALRLVHEGKFPTRVIRIERRIMVPTSALIAELQARDDVILNGVHGKAPGRLVQQELGPPVRHELSQVRGGSRIDFSRPEISVKEAAEALGMPVQKVYQDIRNGTFPARSTKTNGRIQISTADLLRALGEKLEVGQDKKGSLDIPTRPLVQNASTGSKASRSAEVDSELRYVLSMLSTCAGLAAELAELRDPALDSALGHLGIYIKEYQQVLNRWAGDEE